MATPQGLVCFTTTAAGASNSRAASSAASPSTRLLYDSSLPPAPTLAAGPDGLSEADLARVVAALRVGEAIAYPTETFYGLGARALDAAAVARLIELLALYRSAAASALPFMPKAACAYAHSLHSPQHEASAWKKAQEQWWKRDSTGEGQRADVRLALRGRDPFDDDRGDEAALFRSLARRVFGSDGIFARE